MNKSAEKKMSQRDSYRVRQLHNYILVRSLGIERTSGLGMSAAVFYFSVSDFLTQLAMRITDMIQLFQGIRYKFTGLDLKCKAKAGLSIE